MIDEGERLIILPGDLEFDEALGTPPPDWRSVAAESGTYAFVTDPFTGLLRTVDGQGCQEYLLGGEFEERLSLSHELDQEGICVSEVEGAEEIFIDW